MAANTPHDYQVNLDQFRGPLDLLLYLVKRDEVDVLDIPIARIAEQFRDHLEVLVLVDVERAGDFLVLAATLMELKSKMLLPRPAAAGPDGAEDPRRELVRQLLQYKRVKEAAALLEGRAERQGQRLARQPLPEPARAAAQPALRPVELWDLVSAFGRLMRETMAHQPQAVVVDHTPLHVHMETVVGRLRRDGRLPLRALFTPPHTRARLVGLFLAVLELTKGRRVVPEQEAPFAEIWVALAPGEGEAAAAAPAGE
jgi:segregation and condensation protein A